jgi:hypothetical protein
MWHSKNEGEKSGEEGRIIKWLGENGEELVGTKKYLRVYEYNFSIGSWGSSSRML